MSSSRGSSTNLVELYTRIPDYSEVKHLSHSDFINTLERLKEEFRQCRASLYQDEQGRERHGGTGLSSSGDDVDFVTERTSNFLNIHDSTHHPLKFGKLKTSNLHRNVNGGGGGPSTLETRNGSTSLSVKGCELHRSPYGNRSCTGAQSMKHTNYNKPSRSLSVNFDNKNNLTDSAFHEDEFGDEDVDSISSGSSGTTSDLSKWSSSPDLLSTRPFVPPSNIEKRICHRRALNNSAPSLSAPEDENPPQMFKANPVPSHVYKPLYDFIMLKNQRRSQRVREQSKQKLLAQVKPFSFAKDAATAGHSSGHLKTSDFQFHQPTKEILLNNARPIKHRKPSMAGHIKTFNYFKASPAPPRTKALMAAMKLKEQQEYRELKKRLRAEALLKNATLPPSMAARDKKTKLSNSKLDSIIQEYQNSYNSAKDSQSRRNLRETSVLTDDTSIHTDEDRLSEDSYRESTAAFQSTTTKPFSISRKPKNNFTPYGKSRHASAASGVFECTSNDNLASKLRIQATRKREAERMRREEEELLKLMRNESRRKKLKDSHLMAWRRAHSYSSTQDIAMRRQLRMAASILERETFVREMSRMLSRVRSAPLLLEGVREKKSEPCRKHKEEFLQLSHRSINKCESPRFQDRTGGSGGDGNWMWNRYKEEASETVALAEGSLTNSDNESRGSLSSDEEEVGEIVSEKNGDRNEVTGDKEEDHETEVVKGESNVEDEVHSRVDSNRSEKSEEENECGVDN